jgi:hypothetical protein
MLDVSMLAATKPKKPHEAEKTEHSLIEAVVVVPGVGWHLDVLGRSSRWRSESREANERDRGKECLPNTPTHIRPSHDESDRSIKFSPECSLPRSLPT